MGLSSMNVAVEAANVGLGGYPWTFKGTASPDSCVGPLIFSPSSTSGIMTLRPFRSKVMQLPKFQKSGRTEIPPT